MVKDFDEALRDGFTHIKELSDPAQIQTLRKEGVLIDEEGYYSFFFGEHKELELAIEPLMEDENEERMFYISLYKNRVRLTEPLPIWTRPKNQSTKT